MHNCGGLAIYGPLSQTTRFAQLASLLYGILLSVVSGFAMIIAAFTLWKAYGFVIPFLLATNVDGTLSAGFNELRDLLLELWIPFLAA